MIKNSLIYIVRNLRLDALALLLKPDIAPEFKEVNSMTRTWGRMYGAAALTVGSFAILTYLHMDETIVRVFLQTFMIFHLLVAIVAFIGYRKGNFHNPAVAILHSAFAIATVYFYLS